MSQAQQDFISKYNDYVQQITAGTGIYPETIFSQAIVESQKNGVVPGTLLATKYNNLFGIKDSSSWNGETVNLNTGEVFNGNSTTVSANFRVYNSPEESFLDYVNFLKNNSRYEKAGVFDAQNYTDQINAVASAGYATNPSYATLLNNIANSITDYITPLNIGLGIVLVGVLIFTFYHLYNKTS